MLKSLQYQNHCNATFRGKHFYNITIFHNVQIDVWNVYNNKILAKSMSSKFTYTSQHINGLEIYCNIYMFHKNYYFVLESCR